MRAELQGAGMVAMTWVWLGALVVVVALDLALASYLSRIWQRVRSVIAARKERMQGVEKDKAEAAATATTPSGVGGGRSDGVPPVLTPPRPHASAASSDMRALPAPHPSPSSQPGGLFATPERRRAVSLSSDKYAVAAPAGAAAAAATAEYGDDVGCDDDDEVTPLRLRDANTPERHEQRHVQPHGGARDVVVQMRYDERSVYEGEHYGGGYDDDAYGADAEEAHHAPGAAPALSRQTITYNTLHTHGSSSRVVDDLDATVGSSVDDEGLASRHHHRLPATPDAQRQPPSVALLVPTNDAGGGGAGGGRRVHIVSPRPCDMVSPSVLDSTPRRTSASPPAPAATYSPLSAARGAAAAMPLAPPPSIVLSPYSISPGTPPPPPLPETPERTLDATMMMDLSVTPETGMRATATAAAAAAPAPVPLDRTEMPDDGDDEEEEDDWWVSPSRAAQVGVNLFREGPASAPIAATQQQHQRHQQPQQQGGAPHNPLRRLDANDRRLQAGVPNVVRLNPVKRSTSTAAGAVGGEGSGADGRGPHISKLLASTASVPSSTAAVVGGMRSTPSPSQSPFTGMRGQDVACHVHTHTHTHTGRTFRIGPSIGVPQV